MTINKVHLEEQEKIEGKNARSPHLKNNAEFEEQNCSRFAFPELALNTEKITNQLPFILNNKQQKSCRRCRQIQKSCSFRNQINFLNYFDFINTNKVLPPIGMDLEEANSNSIHIFHGTGSLLDIPADMLPACYTSKSIKQRRRIKSVNNLSDFIVECSPLAHSEKVILSPSVTWILDSVETTMRRQTLINNPLLYWPVTPDAVTKEIRARLDNIRSTKFLELKSSPSSTFSTLSEEHKALKKHIRKQRSEAKISQKMLLSCSGTNSTSSYDSTLSTDTEHFATSALLYCVRQSKIPSFVFCVDADRGDVFVASPLKIKSSVETSLDYIYLFHSWKDSKREPHNHVLSASSLVGKMKVSTSLFLDSNRSKFMETEFVLFGTSGDPSTDKQKSLSNLNISNGFSRKVAEMFRRKHSSRNNTRQNIDASCLKFEGLQELLESDLSTTDATGHAHHLTNDFLPNNELAAIIVKDYGHASKNCAAFGGWGLKFLQKIEVDGADSSQEPSSSSGSCEKFPKRNNEQSTRAVTVLIPAGCHGGPLAKTGGPSCLTERWKSNGHCDCGGWDIGCPLKVLNNSSAHSKVLPKAESKEFCKSSELFMEGAKHAEPTLKLLNVSEDAYLVYFHSSLSALQSFSTGVALIHSQTPELCPNL